MIVISTDDGLLASSVEHALPLCNVNERTCTVLERHLLLSHLSEIIHSIYALSTLQVLLGASRVLLVDDMLGFLHQLLQRTLFKHLFAYLHKHAIGFVQNEGAQRLLTEVVLPAHLLTSAVLVF